MFPIFRVRTYECSQSVILTCCWLFTRELILRLNLNQIGLLLCNEYKKLYEDNWSEPSREIGHITIAAFDTHRYPNPRTSTAGVCAHQKTKWNDYKRGISVCFECIGIQFDMNKTLSSISFLRTVAFPDIFGNYFFSDSHQQLIAMFVTNSSHCCLE